MTRLPIATDGPCAGHGCDNCALCRSGHCCRRDNPDYRLPREGEWDGPIYGHIGVLAEDGERIQCHCCGEWFRGMIQWKHLMFRHDLTVQEYKAIFGIARTRGLVATQHHEQQVAHAKRLRAEGKLWFTVPPAVYPTPEQLDAARHGQRRTSARLADGAWQRDRALMLLRRGETKGVGVYYSPGKQRWVAEVKHGGQLMLRKRFATQQEALAACLACREALAGEGEAREWDHAGDR